MKTILFYLPLILMNLPFAINKNNKARFMSWLAIGFVLGMMASSIINNLD